MHGRLVLFGFRAPRVPSTRQSSRCTTSISRPSQEILSQFIAAHPKDPLPLCVPARPPICSNEMDRLKILESEFLRERRAHHSEEKAATRPAVRAQFYKALDDTPVARKPRWPPTPGRPHSAVFPVHLSGLSPRTTWRWVEKRQFSSLSPAKRSNSYAQRLLKLIRSITMPTFNHGFRSIFLASMPVYHPLVSCTVENREAAIRNAGVGECSDLVAPRGHYFKPDSRRFCWDRGSFARRAAGTRGICWPTWRAALSQQPRCFATELA